MPLINVSDELHAHYTTVSELSKQVATDDEETGSSKAAILNANTTILKELSKIQNSLYTSERIALLQDAIVEALAEKSQEFKHEVLLLLEDRLEQLAS